MKGSFISDLYMLRLVTGLAAVLALSPLATAGTVLYATRTTPDPADNDASSIYGYCVKSNGGLGAITKYRIRTAGQYPRRLLVANGVLYVAETDRVEAFSIGPKGGLTRLESTTPKGRMNPHDLAVSDDGTTLYVPRREQSQIVSYKIGANGFEFGPNGTAGADDYDSCVHRRTRGDNAAGRQLWESMAVRGNRLYVSLRASGAGVRVYTLRDDNSFPSQQSPGTKATVCRANEDGISNYDEKRGLGGPRTFVLGDDAVYVQRVGRRWLTRYELETDGANQGLFKKNGTNKKGEAVAKPTSRTVRTSLYDDLIAANQAIIGSVFARGRVDSFLLNSDGELPRRRTKATKENLVETPVRIRADMNTRTLYVPGGDLDRIQAYRLRDDGELASTEPFSETDAVKGSFPNDAIVVTTTEECE